jgi:hypothetical protein
MKRQRSKKGKKGKKCDTVEKGLAAFGSKKDTEKEKHKRHSFFDPKDTHQTARDNRLAAECPAAVTSTSPPRMSAAMFCQSAVESANEKVHSGPRPT